MENRSIQADIDELQAVRRQAAVWRVSLVVILLVVVVSCLVQLRKAATSLVMEGPTRDRFTSQLGEMVKTDIVPLIQDYGSRALKSVDINAQVSKLNARVPDVTNASMEELRTLSTNMPTIGQKVLKAEFEKALNNQMATLQKEFPDADEAKLKDFLGAMTEQTQVELGTVTASLFDPHLEAMNDIIGDLDTIKSTEKNASADIPTWEMAFLLTDIMRGDFVEGSADVKAAEAKAPKAGKGKK